MKKLNYLLSYLYPITVELTGSAINPVLEVVYSAGKYSLNSKNTNYSYGSLQTLFIKLFKKLKLNWHKINDVLILGYGTGSIAEIIVNYKPDSFIEGVEIDSKIIELDNKYFKTNSLKNITLHCSSAERFLKDCNKKYDLIIIDVYLDLNVPESVEDKQFLELVNNALQIEGMVIFNKYIHSKTSREQITPLKLLYQDIFSNLVIMTIMITGKIFIARKRSRI